MLLYVPELMLHVSRPVRWDSDHVTIMNDETMDLCKEIVRCDALDRVHVGLDYFDASINRIGAYVIGSRATQKCMLQALLEPLAQLRQYEANGQGFQRLALLEECKTLPATLMVTVGGFLTNAVYCFYQNGKNKTWGDYSKTALYGNNLMFCALAGILWYSQFFGLSLGKGFLTSSPALLTFSWCILMSLNVTFSNVWGIILKEWKGCSSKTIAVLVIGLLVLIVSSFLPELLK